MSATKSRDKTSTTKVVLSKEDHQRDADFAKVMHSKSDQVAAGFSAMLAKDRVAMKVSVDEYFKHFDNKKASEETNADRESRVQEYASLTNTYYNLVTDIYEYGWGQSFHFSRYSIGEPFYQAMARHEHFLAMHTGLKAGMKVLDVGCGVGGPGREIAKFTDAHITGINNNDYQIERATRYAAKEGLSDQLAYVKGDFMQMPFPDNSFDAVYAIEATVHAPDLEGVYSEIFRVLKPGGIFGVYEWLMTDDYDPNNIEHREIRLRIETGGGISKLVTIKEGLAAVQNVGFELLHHEDLARRNDEVPWYWPLSGEMKYTQTYMDVLTTFRMTPIGRSIVHGFIGLLEKVGIAAGGTKKTTDALHLAAKGLVAGGKGYLFTPMYMMICKKPMN